MRNARVHPLAASLLGLCVLAGTAGDARGQGGRHPPLAIDLPEVVLADVPFRLTVTDTAGGLDFVIVGGGARLAAPPGGAAPDTLHLVGGAATATCVVRAGAPPSLAAPGLRQEFTVRLLPGWLSLLPPLLAIGLALLARQVVVALLLGIWVGAVIVYDFNPLLAFLRLGDRYLTEALADDSHAAILLFSTILGGMVGILSRSGATEGLVGGLVQRVRLRRGGQVSTAVMGTVIFFDDYANTLLVGNTMRPLTDRLLISREKLSYLVDSTAAPIATIAVISTWVGFEVGLIQEAMARVGMEGSAYTFFLRSIPFSFYPILTILFVYLIASLGRDYGPMLQAELRAVREGLVLRPGAQPASETSAFENQAREGPPAHPLVAVLPIAVVILTTAGGLWYDGRRALLESGASEIDLQAILNSANSFAVLTWAALAGAVLAGGLALGTRRLDLRDTLEGWLAGAKAMLIAVVILLLAWSLSSVCATLHTADFLVEVCRGALSARLLPALTFVLASVISFATGTSWGTMAILMPLVFPLGAVLPLEEGIAAATAQNIHLAAISAVLAGAVFGDHCSPISDTTIMSSLASGSDHVDHVRTQLPYAATVGAVAVVFGYLPTGLGVAPGWSLLAGGAVVAAVIWRWGRRVRRQPR